MRDVIHTYLLRELLETGVYVDWHSGILVTYMEVYDTITILRTFHLYSMSTQLEWVVYRLQRFPLEDLV